jgi:hypothetical protein
LEQTDHAWRQAGIAVSGGRHPVVKPDLTPPECVVAQVEGWILGVPGLILAKR